MAKAAATAESSPTVEPILKIAERMDNELKELPMPSHIGIVNVLLQLCQHRGEMIEREERKKAEQDARLRNFSPHQQKM